MKIAFLFVVLFTFAAAEVVILTPDNFESVVLGKDAALVKFFAPWCGHCKKLAQPFEAASNTLAGRAVLAEVDCDVHKDLCSDYGVRGYPTLKWFPKNSGTPEDFGGGRQEDEIVSWVSEKVGVKSVLYPIPSFDDRDILDTINDGKKLFIKFFTPWCGHCKALAPEFKKLSDLFYLDDIVIAELNCEVHNDVCGHHGVTGYPTILYFDGDYSHSEKYAGSRDLAGMTEFINEKTNIGRNVDGSLQEFVGRIAEVDKLVKDFKDLSNEEMENVLIDVQNLAVDEADAHYYKIYVMIMQRLMQDNSYFDKEVKRLESLLEKPMKRQLKERLLLKGSILKAFE